MAVVAIPKVWMGTTMQEDRVKSGLRRLNPDIHFDLGSCLNLWHPFKDSRQNVFYRGASIGAMDRGTLPEVPVWTTKREMVEIPWQEVLPGEIALYGSAGVTATCQLCYREWDLGYRPTGTISCPSLCGNIGQSVDATLFAWENKMGNTAHVFRKVKDRVILVGWRHTFYRLLRTNIPGITKKSLEAEFGVDLDPKVMDEVSVDEDVESKILDRKVAIA